VVIDISYYVLVRERGITTYPCSVARFSVKRGQQSCLSTMFDVSFKTVYLN